MARFFALGMFSLLTSATAWGQQYKADKAGPVPRELSAGIAQSLDKLGFEITTNNTPYCEIWMRAALPAADSNHEQKVTLPNIPSGALLGVIRFDSAGSDRRGQAIMAGVYTLRYGIMPMDSKHEGAAPQRDFLIMTPAAIDRDLNTRPSLDELVVMSRKASGTAHPAVLSIFKADVDTPGFSQQGDSDWVLQSKVGDLGIAIVVIGTAGSF